MLVPRNMGNASGMDDFIMKEELYVVVGASAGALALLTILLFSIVIVLLCVVVMRLRRMEQYIDTGKTCGSYTESKTRSSDVKETSDCIALNETGLTNNKASAVMSPSRASGPDSQHPNTKSLEPAYSCVRKQRPSVKAEQHNDHSGREMGKQSLSHNSESVADAKPPLKSTPWTVQVDSGGYSRLRHTDPVQKRQSRTNRYSMPLLNEMPDETSGVPSSDKEGQPYISPVRPASHIVTEGNYTFLKDVEDPPPPLPSRLSASLELVLESNDKGEGSGKGRTQYLNTPQPVVNEMLYDEVTNTAPVKLHPIYDAPALESGKKNIGPESLYDEIR